MFVSTGLMKAFSFVSMIPLARGGVWSCYREKEGTSLQKCWVIDQPTSYYSNLRCYIQSVRELMGDGRKLFVLAIGNALKA